MTISTHVLDTALGRPAVGIAVRLQARDGTLLDEARTDADGRIAGLTGVSAEPAAYHLRFDTGAYFAATGHEAFYPEVVVTFRIAEPRQHYHVPLLLSPFAYSTYRGS
jgi:5-hydroxyisourate hydrolase